MRVGRVGQYDVSAFQARGVAHGHEKQQQQLSVEKARVSAEPAQPAARVNRPHEIFNSSFHRNAIEAVQLLGRGGYLAAHAAAIPRPATTRHAFDAEPPVAPTSVAGALKDPRVQGRRPLSPPAEERFDRHLETATELRQALATADAARPPAAALGTPVAKAAEPSVVPLVEPTPPSVIDATRPVQAVAPPSVLAAEIVREQAYVLDAQGRRAPLSQTQQAAVATQLSRFTSGQLEKLQDEDVQLAVVDPYNTPSDMTWDMSEAAFYDTDRKTVFLSQYRLDGTVIHETAHALDNVLAQRGQWWSDDVAQMQRAFEDYRQRVQRNPAADWDAQYDAYAARDIREFTAEGTRMYLESDQTRRRLQSLDPAGYQAIAGFLSAADGAA